MLWYPICPTLSFLARLRSWHSSAKNFLNPIHFCSFAGFFTGTCRHRCRFHILRPHDAPSRWLVLPCAVSCHRRWTVCSHQWAWSYFKLERISQSACSFADCWFWGPQLWFFCIGQADDWSDSGVWIRGSWCTCYSTTWDKCIWRSRWIYSWVPCPLLPYSSRLYICHSVEVGVGLSGTRWNSMALWGILLGQSVWYILWSLGYCRALDSWWYLCACCVLLLVVLEDPPN